MIEELLESLRKGTRRDRASVKRQLLTQAGAELAKRHLRAPEKYSNVSIEALYRGICTKQYAGFRLEPANDEDDPRIRELLLERMAHLRSIELADDPVQAREAELKRCKADFVYWLKHWGWGFDPRLPDAKRIPFVPFRRQIEIVEFILSNRKAKRPCGIKKSRDVGLTVITALLGLWFWLFDPGVVVTYGSLKEQKLHKVGDPDSIFEKIKHGMEGLPDWMMPRGFDPVKNLNVMLFINPETGSVLKGEVGDNMGRGGRANIFFADEFSECGHQKEKHSSITGSTDFAVYFGTSAGPTTYFYRLEAESRIPFLQFPWYYDPRKVDNPADVGNPAAKSEWAKAKKAEIGPELMAQQYECDDNLADPYILIRPEWVAVAQKWTSSGSGQVIGGFDVADGGEDEHVLALRQGARVPPLKTWTDLRWEQTPPIIDVMCKVGKVDHLNFDASGIGANVEVPLRERAAGAYNVCPIRAQDTPTKIIYRAYKLPADQIFANRTTELWFAMADRFRKTYEHEMGDAVHPEEERIALPPDSKLAAQLTSRRYEVVQGGKLKLEDKKKMLKSPDRADALSLCEDITQQLAERGSPVVVHKMRKAQGPRI